MKKRVALSTTALLGSVVFVACVSAPGTRGLGEAPVDDEATGEAQDALRVWSPLTSLRLGGVNSDTHLRSAIDTAGNMIVVGTFGDPMTVGGGATALTSLGGSDAFVVKLSPSGAVLWSRRVGGTGNDTVSAVAVDGSNNVIITGEMSEPVDFGGGPVAGVGYIAKLNACGNHVWSKGFTKVYSVASTQPNAVAANASGAIVLGGLQSGAIDYGAGNILSTGPDNLGPFVQVLAADGSFLWGYGGVTTASIESEQVNGVAIDASGNVAVVGDHRFGLSMGCATSATSPYSDMFLMKLTSTGACAWSATFGATSGQVVDRGRGVAFGAGGAVLATGSLGGAGTIGGTALPAGGDFVVSLTSAGAFSWVRPFGSTSIGGIATDLTGNLLLGGTFTGTVNVGGSNLLSAGGSDVFFARYSAANAHLWSERYGNSFGQSIAGAAAAPNGDAVFVGSFSDTMSFGGSNLTSAGSADLFVARYGMVEVP